MHRVFFLAITAVLFFICEFVLFNSLGVWFTPNFLLLLVIYATLTWGVQSGLCAAVFAGIIRDSFSACPFGMYFFSFVICAYALIAIYHYFDEADALSSKVVIAIIVCFINLLIHYVILSTSKNVSFMYAFRFVMIPQIVATGISASFVFKRLKICALRLSV